VLWFDVIADIEDILEAPALHQVFSLIMSSVGAILVTVIFIDLYLRWPPKSS